MSERFTNQTPLAARALLLNDERGATTLTWVAKATYAIGTNGLTLAEPQREVRLTDEYGAEPAASPLRLPSDAVVGKTATDILVIGHAHPASKPAASCEVQLRVGESSHSLKVFGNRRWTIEHDTAVISDPEPFETIPLSYEYAYGGVDPRTRDADQPQSDPRNPLGIGYLVWDESTPADQGKHKLDAQQLASIKDLPLPNIEAPDELITTPTDRPQPAGFGPLAPNWEPRLANAGTYDDFPLLPTDFDRKFHNVAPAPLQVPDFLKGGELVQLVGANADGPLQFAVPTFALEARVKLMNSEPQTVELVLDTVLLDADESCVELVFRGGKVLHGRVHELESSELVGSVQPAADDEASDE